VLTVDDLGDVDLDRPLVSREPGEWLVPESMGLADSVWEWWKWLQRIDQLGSDRLIEACLVVMDSSQTRREGSPAMYAAETLLETGLTMDGVEDITGVSMRTVFGRRLYEAHRMLREGVSVDEATERTGARRQDVQRHHSMLHNRHVKRDTARRHPDIRVWAVRQTELGVPRRELSQQISERWGVNVTVDTISQWVSRDRRKRQEAS
jgi:hypothetical protein